MTTENLDHLPTSRIAAIAAGFEALGEGRKRAVEARC
jgi:hypothetical protein